MPECLLIDLDDTLYDEHSYVFSGFHLIADHLASRYGLMPDAVFDHLVETLDQHGRGSVFDLTLERFGLPCNPDYVAGLVALYRGHRPDIGLFAGVRDALIQLKARYKLALVTNGLPLMQQQKVVALGLTPLFDSIIYCDELEAPKPAPDGLQAALRAVGARPDGARMIGDNPLTDGLAAEAAGVRFVRVSTPRFAHEPDQAWRRVSRFTDILSLLA